jgi:hypothetical protein
MKNNRIKISHLLTNGGNAAQNQFTLTTEAGRYFQSYDSVIAFIPKDGGAIVLGSDWDYSNTTLRYLYQFLGHPYYCKADIIEALKDGRMVEGDLNIIAPDKSKFKKVDISRTLDSIEYEDVSINQLINQLINQIDLF